MNSRRVGFHSPIGIKQSHYGLWSKTVEWWWRATKTSQRTSIKLCTILPAVSSTLWSWRPTSGALHRRCCTQTSCTNTRRHALMDTRSRSRGRCIPSSRTSLRMVTRAPCWTMVRWDWPSTRRRTFCRPSRWKVKKAKSGWKWRILRLRSTLIDRS